MHAASPNASRHAAIFGAFDSLNPAKPCISANDHDPLPLLAQFKDRYGDGVEISYVAVNQAKSSSISCASK